ncbi:unnamed protein product [Brassicogethes aeneus]|uniref:Sugar phosphate exchanger 3 n=1 Tax=Brassicogethes aeneus TaxID=1431903 RepID=A0A9P0AVR4_BRAAE|nr:unnamed protein product [Brassicogethes aeneus]
MSQIISEVPWGWRILQKITDICCPRLRINREKCFRWSVLFLTYISYMCYHLTRKPISVVKTVLHRNCSEIKPDHDPSNPNWCDFAPFDGSDSSAKQMLGELDSAFLFSYAIAMFLSGFLAERINLRYFLSIGMLLSGIFSYLFGIGKTYEIHNIYYYVAVQALAGIFQTTGWPGVVTVMSNWFGKSKRGLIFGLWNSHTSIGNMLGSWIAGAYVETDWAYSFIIPGLVIGVVGFILFLFLVVNPTDVGLMSEQQRLAAEATFASPYVLNDEYSSGMSDSQMYVRECDAKSRVKNSNSYIIDVQRRQSNEGSPLLPRGEGNGNNAIGFFGACKIPGVIEFSLSLFFSKLVSYTFLYWLPSYLNSTKMSARVSADISTLFDVGGIAGAIIAGVISDKTGMSAVTCSGMLLLAAPMMFVYQTFSHVSLATNMLLLMVLGLLVNGPYALITTAVSAELGNHKCLDGNAKAMATVTAIIDGTGSIGAALGPLFAGFLAPLGWEWVFTVLTVSEIISLILLVRLSKNEIQLYIANRRLLALGGHRRE